MAAARVALAGPAPGCPAPPVTVRGQSFCAPPAHGWGATRCRKFLERNGVSEIKLIGALTERQRHLLAEQLRGCPAVAEASVDAEVIASRGHAADRELVYA